MKKRSLFKRLLSGFVATAMALSICFSDRVFEDLFASADATPTVKVKFVDENGTNIKYVKPEDDTNSYRYFVLGALVKKADYTEGLSATLNNEPKLYAWQIQEFDPENDSGEKNLVFDQLRKNDHNFNDPDSNDEVVSYNSSEYVFIARAYRYWGQNDWAVQNNGGKIEPTNIIKPEVEKYTERSSDTFPGFTPGSVTDESNGTINVTFTRNTVNYYVNMGFSRPTTISESDYLYAVIEVSHRGSDEKTYAVKQIVTDGAVNEAVITIQDKSTCQWTDAFGSSKNGEQFNGSELGAKFMLYKGTQSGLKIDELLGTKGGEIEDGGFVKGQKLKIYERTKEQNESKTVTNFYENVNLLKLDEFDNYTFRDILGSAVNFGIVADKFNQKDHSQTNLAVNYFHHGTNSAMEPNLSDPSAGEIYIGKFANLSTPSDLTDNGTEKFVVGASHPQTGPNSGLIVHTPDKNRIDCHDSNFVTLIDTLTDKESGNKTPLTADYIKNNVVDPMIQQMQAMSNRLASKEANVTPVIADSKITVDTMDYPADATIYVDGDALAKDGVFDPGNNNFQFNKKDGQTIVINFKNTEEVNINKFYLDIELEEDSPIRNLESVKSKLNGSILSTDADSDGAYRSDKNKILDQCIMRKIVWNLNSAKKVSTNATAGIFLNPNADSETYYKNGTSTGWMITAGYFENTKGEWHFPFGEIGPYEKPKTTDVVISKKAITGDSEIPGATLQIVDKVTGKNIGDTIWKYLIEEANEDVEALTTKVGELEDVRYGMKWTSGETAKTVTLRDGSYVLKETGTTFKSGGKEYKVVTSSFDFEITNGKITKVSKDVSEENGSIKYTDTNNTITIRDAQTGGPVTYPVHISKTDITGQKAVAGATLTVYTDTENTADRVEVAHYDSRAVEGSKGTFMLEAGKYVLVEKATVDGKAPSENGKTYKVITTEFKFEVKQNGTVECTSAKASVDNFTADEKANGGMVLTKTADNNEPYFIVCDAANTTNVTIDKSAVTGEHTIKNARLWLTDSTGSAVPGADIITTGNAKTDAFTVALEDGEYTIHEEAAKDTSGKDLDIVDENGDKYNIIPSEVKFTVANGTVTSTEAKASKNDLDENGGVFVEGTTLHVCDAIKPKTSVKISKTDVTGNEELKGATLTLFHAKADGTKGDKVAGVSSWTSDGSAKWTVQLQEGDYILEESGDRVTDKNNWEYEILNTAVKFSIDKDGNIAITSNNSKTDFDSDNSAETGFAVAKNVGTRDAELTICDAAKKTPVKFNKKDITGQEELAGATLTVYKYDESKADKIGKKVDEAVSSKDAGSVFELSLPNGKYVLQETGTTVTDNAGNEYDVIKSTLTFEVNNGTVTAADAKTAYDTTATEGYFYKNETTIEICDAKKVVVPDKLKVKVDKTAVTGEAVIENAHLKIVDSNNVVKGELTTTKTEKSFEVELEDGTYTLTEEPVDGKDIVDAQGNKYKVIPSSVTFTIENGQITSTTNTVDSKDKVDQNKGGVVYSGTTFTVCDAQYSKVYIHLSKKDITGANEVKGAVITLYNAKSDGTKGDKVQISGVDNPWTSNGSTLSFQLEKGNYILEESGDEVVSNNIKYKVLSSTVNFTVDENGKVTVTSNNTKPDFVNDSTLADGYAVLKQDEGALEADLTICDAIKPKTSVTISKTDVTGNEELAGATLTLFYAKADGTKGDKVVDANNPWTSNGSAKWTVQLQEGDYILEESGDKVTDKNNWEYEILNTAVKFSIDKDGNIAITSNNSKTDFDSDNSAETGFAVAKNVGTRDAELTICDAAKKTPVKFNKKDITGKEELEGATLTVYKYDATKEGGIGESVNGAVSSKKANSVFELALANGKYVLEETGTTVTDNAGNEYDVIKSTLTFEVNNGTVTAADAKTAYDTTATEGYFYKNETIIEICDAKKSTPTPTPTTTTVKFNKKDITGQEELAGATLTVYKYDATAEKNKGEKVNEAVSSKDAGSVFELQLPDGKYVLEETGTTVTDNAGNEYDVITTTLVFEVNNGTVTATGAKSTYESNATTGYFYQNGTTIEICDAKKVVVPDKLKVKVDKTAVTGEAVIENAHLKIVDSNNVVKGEVTTTKTEKSFEVELEDGTYTLTEEPVDGKDIVDAQGNKYKVIPSAVTFTIENGQITSTTNTVDSKDKVDQNKGGVVYSGTTFTICDAKKTAPTPTTTAVKFNKKDITGQEELAGATLTVYKYDESKTDKIGEKVDEAVSSKDAGSVFELQLPDGKYVLQETGTTVTDNAGNEYDVIKSTLTFEVNNGTVTAADAKTAYDTTATEGYFYKNGTTIEICDAKKSTPTPTPTTTTVKFNKKDITGQEELAGATLTVYKYDESKTDKIGEKVDEAVSSKDAGSVFELQLPDGKYVLQETGTTVTDNAGNEYDVIKSTLTFEVNNGTVTAADAKTAYDTTATEGYFYKNETTIEICDAKKATPTPTPTKTKVVFDKKTISGDEELAGAILTITKKGESKSQSWTSQIGKTWEVELEEGTYELTESGDSVVDAAGNKYDVITSKLEFTVNSDGTVTATGAKTAYDDKATTGYFYQNGTTIEICDAKKATSDDDSKPDGDSSKPSDDSSKPSGGDNDGDNDSSKPSGGDNDGDNDSSKGKKPSGGDNDGDNDSNKGKKPSGGDEDADNTPNTGFAGSTFAAAALLAAVSVLAVMKKKDE